MTLLSVVPDVSLIEIR